MNSYKKSPYLYLDIQPEVLRIGYFENSWGRMRCVGNNSIKTKREMLPWSVNEDLKEFFTLLKSNLNTSDMNKKPISLSLPVSQIIIKTVEVPILDPKEIGEAIKFNTFWENLIQLPGEIEDYSIVYEIVKKNKVLETSILFVLIVKKELLKHIVEVSKSNGFNVSNIEPRFISLIKLFQKNKNFKYKKNYILIEIGPVENYLVFFSANIPTVINLFLSPQDKINLQNGFGDKEFSQKLTKKYISQIEQAVSSKLGKINEVNRPDLYVYSTHNNTFDFQAEFKVKMHGFSVNFLEADDHKIRRQEKIFPIGDKMEIIYGMASEITKRSINQKWLKTFNLNNLHFKDSAIAISEPLRFRMKALLTSIIVLGFFIWSQVIDEQIKTVQINLEELVDKNNYYSKKKLQYDKLLNRESIIKKKLTVHSFFNDNQSRLLNFQNTINQSLSKGVWFKSEKFESDNGFLISGVSISDKGIIEFIEALRDTKAFNLVNIENIKVLDKQESSSFKLREFTIKIVV